MVVLVLSLALFIGSTAAAGHYGKAPCQSDETSFLLAGTGGQLCAPRCGAGDACPQDLPAGDVVKPRCALNGGDGHKYCALTCYFGKCPDGAACKVPTGAIVGYCVYPSSNFSMALNATTLDEKPVHTSITRKAAAAGHYGKAPCQSDETSFLLAGTGGQLCAPRCGAGDACPQDLPAGDVVKPRCALNGGDGHKYCALTCYFGKCPDGAACKVPTGAIVGYCVYPSSNFSMALNATTLDEKPVRTSITGKAIESDAKFSWNIGVACKTLCQTDPEYSASSWCKHKDRGGCCAEVNPSWDNVPGWKHMTDFCDKLCVPEGPSKLDMCTPLKQFENLDATDPLDAIDKFYESDPSECSQRIGDWVEAYCPHVWPSLLV